MHGSFQVFDSHTDRKKSRHCRPSATTGEHVALIFCRTLRWLQAFARLGLGLGRFGFWRSHSEYPGEACVEPNEQTWQL